MDIKLRKAENGIVIAATRQVHTSTSRKRGKHYTPSIKEWVINIEDMKAEHASVFREALDWAKDEKHVYTEQEVSNDKERT